ncbi:MAG: hypothetical protein ACLSDJ_00430 [Butyricimonas faecihominis]
MKQLMNYLEVVRVIDVNKYFYDLQGRVIGFELIPGREPVCIYTDKEYTLTTKTQEKNGNIQFNHEIKTVAELSERDVKRLNKSKVIIVITDDKKKYYIGNVNLPATIILLPKLETCAINISCSSLSPIF